MARTPWILLALLPAIRADYLLELDLQQYSNPGGQTFRSVCCERQGTTSTGSCLAQDTCDPKFNIRLINFSRQIMTLLGRDYNLGTFPNSDSVTFNSCQRITSDETAAGVQNPLSFIFTRDQFTPGENLRVTMDITHTEGNTNDPIVLNFVISLEGVSGTNSAFSGSITNFASAPSTLSFQFRYRLICTAGTCGNDCSQTSGCPGFSQACVPDCDQATPCQNGGTCQSGRCSCPANYEGIRCESAVTTVPMATTMTPPTTMTMPTQAPIITTSVPTSVPPVTSSPNDVAVTDQVRHTKSDTTAPMTPGDNSSGGVFLHGSIWSSVILCLFTIFHP